MFDSIFGDELADSLSLETGLLAILVAVIMGVVLSLGYSFQNSQNVNSKAFVITLIILPAIITVIVALVGNNIARAFSIAGIFAIIRFRSFQQGPKELAFVLLSMAIGLGCGMGYIAYAVIFGLSLEAVLIVAEILLKDKNEKKILKILIPEDLDYDSVIPDVIQKYSNKYSLAEVKTMDLGSLYRLTYQISVDPTIDQKKFIDELRTKNGNLTITLSNAYDAYPKF